MKRAQTSFATGLLSCALATGCAPACGAARGEPGLQSAGNSGRVDEVEFVGMCDASAAITLSERTFAVADDEDNTLRVYDAVRGGAPLSVVDLSPQILPAKQGKVRLKKKKKKGEADLEAGARIGELAFWMGSHGRNSSGKLKPERLTFFATSLPEGAASLALVGSPYHRLLEELATDPRYAAFGLERAAERAPKEPGALNIEGLAPRTPEGAWIAFRNPTPGGKALLVALLNPDEIIHGASARFGAPELLPLDGLGVRDLTPWGNGYLVLAGPHGSEGASRLYAWDGRAAPRALDHDLSGLNPEAFFSPKGSSRVMLLSDDGARMQGALECKKLAREADKRFRGRWITLRAPRAAMRP